MTLSKVLIITSTLIVLSGCATQPMNEAQRQYLMNNWRPMQPIQGQVYQMPVQKTYNTQCSQMGGFVNCQTR